LASQRIGSMMMPHSSRAIPIGRRIAKIKCSFLTSIYFNRLNLNANAIAISRASLRRMRNHIIHGFPFTRLCAAKMIGAVWLFRNLLDEKSHRANNFIALAFDKGRLTILKSTACSKLKINIMTTCSIACLYIARNMTV
jgi:hypothetical protein